MPAMAMGKRGDEQEDLFVMHQQLQATSHPYYRAVNKVLGDKGFDRYAEGLCAKFYARKVGAAGTSARRVLSLPAARLLRGHR
jgi:hypothetical protein